MNEDKLPQRIFFMIFYISFDQKLRIEIAAVILCLYLSLKMYCFRKERKKWKSPKDIEDMVDKSTSDISEALYVYVVQVELDIK